MNKDKHIIKILKSIIIIFIAVGIAVGGLNAAFGNSENEILSKNIKFIYIMYENVFRTVVVIISSYLSIKMLKERKKFSKMRYISLISFSIFMIIALIIIPAVTGIFEISIAIMPFPWSSMPLQILKDGYFFSTKIESSMIGILIGIYVIYQIVIITGTLIYGRRFHCSMLCPFSGCHAESFSLALPLLKKAKKEIKQWQKKLLFIIKVFMLVFSLFIMTFMAMDIYLNVKLISFAALRNLELIKYMIFEIILFQIFYFTFTGRGYCYYCPAGTFLGMISKIAGQRIDTDKSQCINCKLCDKQCEMGVEISKMAVEKKAVFDMNCVGCGHCVDICPKDNLLYSTKFTRWVNRKNKKSININENADI